MHLLFYLSNDKCLVKLEETDQVILFEKQIKIEKEKKKIGVKKSNKIPK